MTDFLVLNKVQSNDSNLYGVVEVQGQLKMRGVPAPTRGELADRLRAVRPDLRFLWLPFPVVWMLSTALWIALKAVRPGKPPLDLYSAFKSESYDSKLAGAIIAAATTHRISD